MHVTMHHKCNIRTHISLTHSIVFLIILMTTPISSPDSLIVGSLPGESCQTSSPAYLPGGVSFSRNDHKLGIMMSSFNQRRSKMDGTGAWHLSKGVGLVWELRKNYKLAQLCLSVVVVPSLFYHGVQ